MMMKNKTQSDGTVGLGFILLTISISTWFSLPVRRSPSDRKERACQTETVGQVN